MVTFLISFSGVLSAAAAGATRALLLAYILPVTVPAGVGQIPDRLLGWALAFVLAVPAALWLLPPTYHDRIRQRAADACRALARTGCGRCRPRRIRTRARAPMLSAARAGAAERRRGSVPAGVSECRLPPGGLEHGQPDADQPRRPARLDPIGGGPAAERGHRRVGSGTAAAGDCADVLDASADAVATGDSRPSEQARSTLESALADLVGGRDAALDRIRAPSDIIEDRQVAASVLHELVYASDQAGRTVATASAADARPTWARIVGRPAVTVESPSSGSTLVEAQLILSRRTTLRSVWLQNSLRTAAGLAAAVLIIQVTHVGHSFWVALGTLSVLRTTAIGTGANALRALVGTTLGFGVGALLVVGLGTSPTVLWPLLPVMCLLAGFAPTAISFLAGQAAFTALVLILFNLIDPVGWSVGLVRIEDVALGCAAGILAGVLLWPRGAATQIRTALAECYRSSADALLQAARHAVEPSPGSAAAATRLLTAATAASGRLDDAFRSYLSDRGSMSVPVPELTSAANAVGRVRQAAGAIAATRTGAASRTDRLPDGAGDDPARVELVEITASVAGWFHGASACLESPGLLPPAVQQLRAERRVLADERMEPDLEPQAVRGLWSIALHVDGVTRCQPRLVEVLSALAPRSRPASASSSTAGGTTAGGTAAGGTAAGGTAAGSTAAVDPS